MWTDADRETYRDQGGRYPSDLTDAQWATVAPFLAGYDPLSADLREMVNACLYLEKTGCPWRYLPTDFGPWETVRTWHDRFRADGIWTEIAALLTRAVRRKRGRPAEPRTAILDSQSVYPGHRSGCGARTARRKSEASSAMCSPVHAASFWRRSSQRPTSTTPRLRAGCSTAPRRQGGHPNG